MAGFDLLRRLSAFKATRGGVGTGGGASAVNGGVGAGSDDADASPSESSVADCLNQASNSASNGTSMMAVDGAGAFDVAPSACLNSLTVGMVEVPLRSSAMVDMSLHLQEDRAESGEDDDMMLPTAVALSAEPVSTPSPTPGTLRAVWPSPSSSLPNLLMKVDLSGSPSVGTSNMQDCSHASVATKDSGALKGSDLMQMEESMSPSSDLAPLSIEPAMHKIAAATSSFSAPCSPLNQLESNPAALVHPQHASAHHLSFHQLPTPTSSSSSISSPSSSPPTSPPASPSPLSRSDIIPPASEAASTASPPSRTSQDSSDPSTDSAESPRSTLTTKHSRQVTSPSATARSTSTSVSSSLPLSFQPSPSTYSLPSSSSPSQSSALRSSQLLQSIHPTNNSLSSHQHYHSFYHHHGSYYQSPPPFGHISNLADDLYAVAERLLFGLDNGVRDEEKAVRMLQRAANYLQGHVQAQAVLGFCFEFGIGSVQDFKAAEKLYLMAAVKGNGLAGARLSFLRRYGRPHVKIDRVEAEEWIKMVQKLGVGSVEWLIKAADVHRLPAAEYALGVCYHDGVGVQKDPTKAVDYYKRSAAARQPRGEGKLSGTSSPESNIGTGILGYCYGEGFGVEKDEQKAFSLYLSAAQQGESVSMYNVAHCYEEGIGAEKNLEEAIKWYVQSANLGNCYAQNSLGYMYEEGLGVARDEWVAVHWYKLSAEQGYPWAQCNLGFCLQNGIGIEKNEELGSFWYQKAAVQGHSRAQHNLGHAYQYGIGVEKDEAMAVEWYKRSAGSGNAFALHSLGYCYQYGIGTEVDEGKAVKLYHESSTLGHAPAQLSLGCCYRNGIGVPVNEQEAFKWIRLSALGGNDLAQNTLGHLYEDGIGTDKNLKKAVYWYNISARYGNVWALTNLAVLYSEGNGVKRNNKEAVRLLRLAAEQGHVRAQTRLALHLRQGRGCDTDLSEAFMWYEKAAANGSVTAMFALAQCYESGHGCKKDTFEAIKWYERAALWGDQKASERLIVLVGNPAMVDGMFSHGYVAPAA
ncbi:hypothetical protein HDU97_004603 [Phlyctochytrium planicorne]|nr:hypothetical protein HDU97_004603 [Phlyctochytrium planicorne]